MYGGRPPPRGEYPPPYDGRGPPPHASHPGPGQPYTRPPFQEESGLPQPPHHGYQEYGLPDPYRRSRYPSPGPGSDRHTGTGPPRDRSPSLPRGGIPTDHSLDITVGNERTRPGPGPSLNPVPHNRDYPPRHADDDGPDDLGPRRRSPSRGRSRPRSRSRSPDRSRAGSRAKSKSRPRSRSRSRSPEQSRGRAQSRGRSRTHSVSTSSTSSRSPSVPKKTDKSKELERARRHKEIEQMLNMPTKSILKKRPDSEESPLLNIDSPRGPVESANVSREAEHFLTTVKGMEPDMLTSMLSELRKDPHMAQRAGLNPADLSGILGLLGGAAGQQEDNRQQTDIEDEEKFLYGDEDEPPERSRAPTEVPRQHSLSEFYGDTEAAPYDFTPHYEVLKKAYGAPVVAPPHPLGHAGSGEHTPRGHQQQVDMRYHGSASITPDRNIKAETPKLDYPPGTGPLDEKERLEVEEYEKIQDLLKTIGLNLGVTEISKMAAKTRERLNENKPSPKTHTRRPGKGSRRDSPGSSGSSRHGRGHRSHSFTRSRSSGSNSSQSRSRSRSSSPEHKKRNKSSLSDRRSVHVKSKSSREVKTEASDRRVPVPGHVMSQSADPQAPAGHPALSMPAYPQAQPHGLVAPNYLPPGYGQYGNYMPYMPQQWPMYPPPSMGVPPQSPNEDFQNVPASPYDRQYLNTEFDVKGNGRASSRADSSHERRGSAEKIYESQKQKVLEEREKLRKERDIRMKKKEHLMKKLETLRKQQGEFLQTKRCEKVGHKDPLLTEISRLQEEVMSQISVLRKEHEAAEKKRSEIDKVAIILELSASDKSWKVSRASGELEQPPSTEKEKQEQGRSSEMSPVVKSTSSKMASSSTASPDKQQNVPPSAPTPVMPIDPFEYYDAGNHWCQHCNVTSGSMFDFFTHLHSKSHRKTQDPYSRPWASSSTENEKNHSSGKKMVKPSKGTLYGKQCKGSEFLLPVRGFYCLMCEEFYGDAICAEEHVTSHTHNVKYQKQMYENPLYEQRRNLDRQAGLGGKNYSELKRKHEDENRDSKEKEEKPKHSKKEEDKSTHKKNKEEGQKAEEKATPSNKEEEKTNYSKKEQERPKSSKKEEEERSLCTKRDGAEKYKSSKKEEPEGYKYGKEEERYPCHREEEDGYKYRREEEDRSRYVRVEERYKHSGRNIEEEEERSRYSKGKETKPIYDGKEEAKNRSEKEEGKNRPSNKDEAEHPKEENPGSTKQPETSSEKINDPPAFGKFSWKKNENEPAKLAGEEEAKASEGNDEDPVAKAKSIARKLSSRTVIPRTNAWLPYQSNRGRIRPNLPPPTMFLRKSFGVFSKPTPLNAFLSIRPPSTGRVTTLPVAQSPSPFMLPQDIIYKAFGGQEVHLKKPDQSVNPVLSSSPSDVNAREAKPAMTVSMMKSDVAPPGVPEREQNRAVLVMPTPPPSLNKCLSDVIRKSEEPKSNLAVVGAQDLYDFFYSNRAPSSASTANKPAASRKRQNK